MSNKNFNLSEEYIKAIIECCQAALDEQKEIFVKRNIKHRYSNSKGRLSGDLFNRNLVNAELGDNLIARYIRKPPYNMVMIYNKENGYIYNFMRFDRFKDIQKYYKKEKYYYIRELIISFNENVQYSQLSYFEKYVEEDEKVKKDVNRILRQFGVERDGVKGIATILFETNKDMLLLIKCCLLNRELLIADSIEWSEYINYSEPVIVEKINEETRYMQPLNIELNDKSIDRIGRRTNDIKTSDKEKAEDEER